MASGDAEGLKSLNSQLRSLAVSTPTTLDAATLLRDYKLMMGEPLPCRRYGYRDPVLFLRERCAESFLFQGPQANPTLTLIVNDSIKHIDQYVQRQKVSSKTIKGRRRSVPVSVIRTPQSNLVATSYSSSTRREPSRSSYNPPAKKTPYNSQRYYEPPRSEPPKPARPPSPEPVVTPESPKPVAKPIVKAARTPEPADPESADESSDKMEAPTNGHSAEEGGGYSLQRLRSFLEKRNTAYSSQQLNGSAESLRHADADSGRLTSSSLSSRSSSALATLKDELARLVARHPGGVRCGQLLRLYEEEYGRELNFARFGFPSVSACACAVEALSCARLAGGDWLLQPRDAASPPAAPPVLRMRRAPPHHHHHHHHQHPHHDAALLADPDDALPGIEYDPDVYPADCLSFMESIPSGSVAGVAPGDMLAVEVGELYSPSHLWVLRLGPDYDAMDDIMDEMTEYYTKGEGRERVLAAGARRPGQYCSSVFDGDWHRSLIVQLVSTDTVKVLHVDYGTVDTVSAAALRPLLRRWSTLPAMAVRARLAGLRPAAASRRWPRAAAAHCLQLVRDRRLVANVVAVDHEENILELFLIDTSTEEDVNITDELIRAGHADPRPRPALGTSESYLFPLFRVLEAGATPNYAEIHALLRDGIALEYVDAYRRHVPALLPSDDGSLDDDDAAAPPPALDDTSELGSSVAGSPPPSPPPPPPPTLAAANRVPLSMLLLPARSPSPPPPPATVPPSTSSAPSPPPPAPLPALSPAPAKSPVIEEPASVASPAPPPAARPPAAAPSARPAPPQPPPPPRPAPPPHPAAVYALPFCPYSSAAPSYPRQPPTYAYAPPQRFPPAPCPYLPPPTFYPPPPPRFYAPAPGPTAAPAFRPPPPGPPSEPAAVRLTATECEVFEQLSRVEPGVAHRYMIEALQKARLRAAAGSSLNPDAAEFRGALRPPPGFEPAR